MAKKAPTDSNNLNLLSRLLPFIAVIIAPSILFLPLIFTDKVLFWGTSSTQFIPWLNLAWEGISHGSLPLWNIYNGMGAPLLANYQLAFFYPPIWITYLFYLINGTPGLATGALFLVYLHVIWTGLGMVFLTRKMGLNSLSQIVSGLAFSLCGGLIARVNFLSMVWAISWIPWVMLVCLKITQTPLEIYALEPKQRKYQKLHLFLLLIVVISMQLLSGHAQVSWYSLLFAAFWMGFWGWRRGKVKEACKNIMYLGICAIIASLLAAVQLIPTFEYLLQSQRASSVDYSYALNYSFWPSHLLNFISPEFFGNPGRGDYWGFGAFWEDAVYFGFIPLVLTFFTFKAFAKNGSHPLRNVILFLWCGFGISLLLALGKNLPPFPFLYRYVPTFNLFQAPARFMIIGVFCLSLLAGLGVEYWNIPTGRWLYITRLGMMGAVAILIGSILGFLAINGELLTTVRALIFTSVSLLLFCLLTTRISSSFAEMKSHLGWSILVGLVIVADLVYSSTYLIPTIDRSFYDLQNQTSLKLPGNERLWIPQNVEYDLKFGRFFRFTDFRGLENWSNIRMVNLPNTNLLAHVSLVNNFDPFVPDRYQKLVDLIENLGSVKRNAMLQLMNVGMIETINTTSRDGIQFEQINNSTSYSWYSCVEFSKDLNDSQSKLSNLLNDPLRSIKSTLIVEAPEHIGEDDCRQTTNIKIDETSETTTQKEFVIQTSEPGWLLISMTYYPGWIAAIDGKEVPIHPAMMALQTVEVPMGQHTILIKYQPQSCYYGAIISGIILIGIIISFLLLKILRKEDPNGSKNHQQSFTRNHFKS